jgi:hypothetical protein
VTGAFWDDLNRDMKNRVFAAEYERASAEIAAADNRANRAPIARQNSGGFSGPSGSGDLSPALAKLSKCMPERGRGGLDEKVREILSGLPRVLGYHTWNSRKSPSGFPDWVFCGPAGVLYRELKRQSEKPKPKQQEWLDALTAAGCDAAVWRPSDYYSQRIALELAALAGLRVAGDGAR